MVTTTARVFSEADVLETEIRRKSEEVARLTRQLEALRGAPVEAVSPSANDSVLMDDGDGVPAATEEVIPLAEIERRYILRVLGAFHGNRTHTARALGIGTNTLWRKLKAWGEPPARS